MSHNCAPSDIVLSRSPPVFFLTPDRERSVLDADVDIFCLDAGNLSANFYLLVGLGHVHLRRKTAKCVAARQPR